jgi:hypothetical protein
VARLRLAEGVTEVRAVDVDLLQSECNKFENVIENDISNSSKESG